MYCFFFYYTREILKKDETCFIYPVTGLRSCGRDLIDTLLEKRYSVVHSGYYLP
jgi:hypothetical protein